MPVYVFIFSQHHESFRVPEFLSVCHLAGIDGPSLLATLPTSSQSLSRPLWLLSLPDDAAVRRLLARSVLIKSASQLLASAPSYALLYARLRENGAAFVPFDRADQSFAIRLKPLGRRRRQPYILQRINELSFLPLTAARVDLTAPDNVFQLIEECHPPPSQLDADGSGDDNDEPFAVHFARLIGYGQGQLKTRYNLVDRLYIGNTTMDPQLAFLMANLALVTDTSLVLDPFAGTGGILLSAAHFGAHCIGTEINYQIAHARGKSSRLGEKYLSDRHSVRGNFVQQGVDGRLLSLLVADASQRSLWRDTKNGEGIFDALLADPPYGVREKGRKVGNKQRKEHWTLPGSTGEHPQRYPEKTKYGLSAVFLDLLDLAAQLLVVGGRLAFWFPVFPDEYDDDVVPRHGALSLVANCLQSLTISYGRRLLVYEKQRRATVDERAFVQRDCYVDTSFRDRVFTSNGATANADNDSNSEAR